MCTCGCGEEALFPGLRLCAFLGQRQVSEALRPGTSFSLAAALGCLPTPVSSGRQRWAPSQHHREAGPLPWDWKGQAPLVTADLELTSSEHLAQPKLGGLWT